jgi:hypothetical protein
MLGVDPLGVNSDTKRGRARKAARIFSKLFASGGGNAVACPVAGLKACATTQAEKTSTTDL